MMTDSEIQELGKLLKEEQVYKLEQGLKYFNDKTNPNYKFLFNSLTNQKYRDNPKTGRPELVGGYRGCVLEGSSRSGKTWGGIDIIIYLCKFVETNCTINIYRETYNEFKTTLYDDFKNRLDDFDLDNPFHRSKEISSFKIGKNTIHFLGDGKHGGGCDYAFYNEGMFINREVFDQSEMRCRKFWWIDYNPSLTAHWIFNNVIPRPDVGFLRTTYKDNPYLSPQEKDKIMGYEPWKTGSYYVNDNGKLEYEGELISEKHQPPPHKKNIKSGTANEFMHRVYGLGLRGAMKGVIFPRITYIDTFPDIACTYGNDFGFTSDPNAAGRYAEDEENVWFEPLIYEPLETPQQIVDHLEVLGVRKAKRGPGGDLRGGDLITCDSSDKYTGENKGTVEMVKGLRNLGYQAKKVRKTKSNVYWLLSLKDKKIHVIRNRHYEDFKKEQENYRWKEVQGIQINQPIDAFNHFFDCMKYCHIAHNSKPQSFRTDKTLSQLGVNY
jgi:hypothetical protein